MKLYLVIIKQSRKKHNLVELKIYMENVDELYDYMIDTFEIDRRDIDQIIEIK